MLVLPRAAALSPAPAKHFEREPLALKSEKARTQEMADLGAAVGVRFGTEVGAEVGVEVGTEFGTEFETAVGGRVGELIGR